MPKNLRLYTFFLLLLPCFLFSQNNTSAQKSYTVKLSGKIIDTLNGNPIPNMLISVFEKDSLKLTSKTNENGIFTLTLGTGTYMVVCENLSYFKKNIGNFEINEKSKDLELIVKVLSIENLKKVEITVEKALIENKVDRLVYNVEQDATNRGSSALDMLRKVPSVEVDGDGNVSIRGNSKLRVFINGQPSAIVTGSLRDALQTIPADQIEKVEVITNPSSKYDAEGSAGIINLVMKDGKVKGTNGQAQVGIGNRTANIGAGVSTQKGKTGISIRLGSYFWRALNEIKLDRINYLSSGNRQFKQNGEGNSFGGGPRLSIGLDRSINKLNTISFSATGRGMFSSNNNNLAFLIGPNGSNLTYLYNRDNKASNVNFGYDARLNYLKKFLKEGKELSFGFQYSGENQSSNYIVKQLNVTTETYKEQSNNLALNHEYTAQIDYTNPYKKVGIFEIGLKSVLRRVNSEYTFDSFNYATNNFLRLNGLTNKFLYKQSVHAAYIQYVWNISKKFSARVGSRYEFTQFSGERKDSNQFFTGKPYGNFIPSVLLNYNLTQTAFIKFGYTQRVQRPGLFFINPYVNTSDPKNVRYGNPQLEAEFTHNIEISVGNYKKGGGGMITAYYRNTQNSIESIRLINANEVYVSTYGNVGKSNAVGLDLNMNLRTKKYRLFANGGLGFIRIQSTSNEQAIQNLTSQGLTYSLGLGGSYEFKNKLEISGFSRINAPSFDLQGYVTNWYFHTIGLKKRFKDGKMGFGFGIDNPFTPYVYYKTVQNGPNFSFNQSTKALQFGFKINFDIKFGKVEFEKQNVKHKDLTNKDIKQGQENNAGGGE